MSNLPATQIPGVYHRRVGDILVTGLSDGYVDVGYGVFRDIPEQDVKAILSRGGRASPPRISVNTFVLRFADRTLLVDCGSGSSMGPSCGQLPASLVAAGIEPASVNGVLLTHVHPDHSNGLTDALSGEAIFANAEVIVHQQEMDHWFNDEYMAKADERPRLRLFEAGRAQLKPYMDADRVKVIKAGEVFTGITAVPISGHTPGHTAFVVSSRGESMVIWGDIVHVPEVQIAFPHVTMEFDIDPDAAAAARRRMFDMVATDEMLIAGMHLHFPGFGRMRRDGGNYRFASDQWAFEI